MNYAKILLKGLAAAAATACLFAVMGCVTVVSDSPGSNGYSLRPSEEVELRALDVLSGDEPRVAPQPKADE